MVTLAFLQQPSFWQIIIILVVAVLLFGKRLPEVGRSLGKGIVEFKKGIKGIEDDTEAQSSKAAPRLEQSSGAPPYRAPLDEAGRDPRVSRADSPRPEQAEQAYPGGQDAPPR